MFLEPFISISIVIHNQAIIVKRLLNDLQEYYSDRIEVILTINKKENLPFSSHDYKYPLRMILNETQKGFGANHNAAFQSAAGDFFCILNPDIRLNRDPFPELIECFVDNRVGVVAPLIINKNGIIEDSARRFPTPFGILKKAFGLNKQYDYIIGSETLRPDWVAGMFMLFPHDRFKEIGGFDENYFLYYEDVDLCARLKLSGYKVILFPSVSAIHEARRESHRNLKYLKWHLSSIIRFFLSDVFFNAVIRKSVRQSRN